MDGCAWIESEDDTTTVFDVQLHKVVVVVVSVEDERPGVKCPDVDEDVLLEESAQTQTGSDGHRRGVGFHERIRRSERQRVQVYVCKSPNIYLNIHGMFLD